jgi:DNA-binding response OmpR family regulator
MLLSKDKRNILVIEDEAHIAEAIRINLVLSGHEVKLATDGRKGLLEYSNLKPDLIVLDLMMPNMDGFSFLKEIRQIDEKVPIIILTAKFNIKDKVRCFNLGADDYLSKPFELQEFLLRIERLLVRSDWNVGGKASKATGDILEKDLEDLGIVKFASNRIDFPKSEAFNGKESISLTIQEIKILQLFASNIGKPLSRKALLESGWGYQGEITTRTVDNFIVRFRKYFEVNPKKPVHFKSLRAVGYVFDDLN